MAEIGSMTDPTVWTSKEIITAVLATGAVSALLTNILGGLRDAIGAWLRTRRQAAYMAMRLAVILEAYMMTCANFLIANDNAPHDPAHEFPDWDTRLPQLLNFPDDTDGWRSLPSRLADECLQLPNRIDNSQGMIASTIEHAEDRLETDLQKAAAELGLAAWKIAKDLRHAHDLRAIELVWDAPDYLRRSMISAVAARERMDQQNREMWERMEAHLRSELSDTAI